MTVFSNATTQTMATMIEAAVVLSEQLPHWEKQLMVVPITGNSVCCDYWASVHSHHSSRGEWHLFRALHPVDPPIAPHPSASTIPGSVAHDCCDTTGISLSDSAFGRGECAMRCFCSLVSSVFRSCLQWSCSSFSGILGLCPEI
uniref:Uncharacterized protein n=1 Tax=Physcomitrium patens TaxID=3218 RepID=A9SJ77_PHYPA|nr:hypothetical protein PHYPA_002451 [Physcomitrium patens]